MRIWLDDIREMPDGYDIWCKTAIDAMGLITKGYVKFISFDHDLGEDLLNGYDVAITIELFAHYKLIDPIEWDVHSANPVGRRQIELTMIQAEKFWREKDGQLS